VAWWGSYETASIDLILMDIDLGAGMDGADTAREILKTRNVPIVFHTSYSEHEVQDRISGITHYGYIQKSVSDFELMSLINVTFERFDAQEHTP
jgi:CheY-like chemotaxis protein